MTSSYKTLLGLANVDADVIEAEMISTVELKAENADINNAIINNLTIPNGADSYILTSNANSLASWKPNVLSGEVSGLASDTKLTIPNGQDGYILTSDNNSLPSWKFNQSQWIGNWNGETEYKRNNLVTHNHILYRALFDNIDTVPNNEFGSYSLYNETYPAPEPSTLMPDSLHQEIAIRIEPNQRGFLTHFKFYNISLETVDIKIYQYPIWDVVHEQTSVVGLGWQTIELTSPVPVMARQSTLAAMLTNGQPYAYIPQDFDVILNADPIVYIGNDATSTDTVFWFAKPGHPSSPGNPPINGGVFNRTYLIDVIYEVGRTWEVVLDDRPDTVFEEKAQPLRNKTDVDVVDLTVHNSAKFTIQPTSIFEVTPRYLVGTGANKDELKWATNLDSEQLSCRNSFYYENDGRADAGKVLTCVGNTGACNWEYPTQTNAVTMLGDVTGQSNANVINTLAGGTIIVSELLSKSDFPADIVYETKAQPLRNKTEADIGDLVIRNSLKLNLLTLNSGVFNIKYLVGWGDPNFNDCKWINDLYAPIISAQSQLLYPVNAAAGKVLSCVDATGLAQWIDPPSTAVTMGGDVTGSSSATVVNTLANGTINVNQLVTLNGSQIVNNKTFPAGTVKFRSDSDSTKLLRFDVGSSLANTELTLRGISTANRVVIFPDANDTLVGKNTSDVLKNKIINDPSNSVTANGLRAGTAWNIPIGGGAPTAYDVLSYNGTYGDIRWTTPILGGDVTGSYGNTVVNTLAGGTIPVNQLVTVTSSNILSNKNFEGLMYFSDLTRKKLFSLRLDSITANSITNLKPTSSADQTIYLPDVPLSTDTLMGKNTTDIMKNKTIIDVTNTVYANGIRNGSTWTSTFSGAAPTTNQVLSYNGTNAIWGAAAPFVTLAGDVTGPANNNVVSKATTDFAVGRILTLSNLDRIKKLVLWDGGVATDPADHRFFGLGITSSQQRYQVPAGGLHGFYAATSATASNLLFAIGGDGRTTAKMLNVDTWKDPNIQGAWMGWNKDNGSGRTFFANHMGLGYGGWAWLNYNNSGVQTPAGNPSMTLDRDGNLTVRGRVISEGVPDAFSGNWWSADDMVILITLPLHSTGQFYNTRETITSINFSAWTVNMTGIFLPVAGYFRISYRFKLSAREKNNIMVKCNVSVGGTNHPSLYTFDQGFTYQHDLHCEAIVNISAPNMWVSYPKITVMNSSIVTTAKDFELFTGHFTIEKMK